MSNPGDVWSNISLPVLSVDGDGYIVFVSEKAANFLGYEKNSLTGEHLSVLYPGEDDRIKVAYELSQAAKSGSFHSEGWRIKKNRSSFWSDNTIEAHRTAPGQPYVFTCIFYDITDRKKLELELISSEEKYRAMVEGVKEYAIFMLDTRGVILSWNQGGKRIKGYLPGEVLGKHFSIFYSVHDIKAGKPQHDLQQAIDQGEFEEEDWRLRKNGSLFWANVVITALYNNNNQHIGFSKVTRDLSEKRENEEKLRQSEERYRSLVSQVSDYGIFLMDENGHISSWNEGARKIKGYSAGEIIGKHFSIFYPEEEILAGKPAYELKVAREKGKYEEEGWRLKKDGSRFWANVVITSVYNSAGMHIGYSKVTRDLTERKEAEKALRDSSEKYRAIAAQLQATNRELSEVNQELGQFTSVASHDLQEPLRTVNSFLQLIERKLDKTEQAELHSYIVKSMNATVRMRDLIHNLLRYTQLGKTQMVLEPVLVDDILTELLQNLRTAIDNSKAVITISNKLTEVKGDRVQLLQLLQNLVGNALKFNDKPRAEVDILCEMKDGSPFCCVRDNGIGIRENDLGGLFEIFRRLHTKQDFPGSGIGLAICKKIVEKHGGRIWLSSEYGKGTTFYFTLNER